MERPRALPHPGRPLGQAHPLGTLEGPGTPDPGLAGHARRGLPAQPPPLQGVPALSRVAAALPARGPRARAPAHLDGWLHWASRSRLKPFVRAARTLRRHRDGILAAIRLGLSNGRLEGLNSRVRLISHRSFGFHSSAPLIALIYLCCGGIVIDLPLR